MNDQAVCREFRYIGDSSTLGQRWENWLERFKLYLVTADIQDETKVKASFLLHMGDEAYQIYKSLRKKDSSDTLEQCYTFMTNHFVANRSQFTECQVFRRAMKTPEETIDDYALRLRQLAAHCKFEESIDKEILNQLVAGSGMENFQAKCCRENNLDLKTALNIARGYERTAQNVNGLLKPTARELARSINYTSLSKTRQDESRFRDQTDKDKCNYCNKSHKRGDKCPAKGATCKSCGKKNHYAVVCRSSGETSQKYGQNSGAEKSYHNARGTRINNVQIAEENKILVDVDDYAEYLRFKQGKSNQAYEMKMVRKDTMINDGPRAEVNLAETMVDFLVDTGAPVNIIDEPTFNSLTKKPTLLKSESNFYGYQSTTPLPILGEFYAITSRNDHQTYAKYVVVKGKSECLLSFKTSTNLKIIQMVNQVSELTDAALKAKFPKLFSGKMGKITGVEIKLEIDLSVKPIKQKLRPIAFHLRSAVEEEINKQVDEDILERLDENSGPTEWVSNLVIVPKSTTPELKIRITSDSRAVNKAILRTRFPGKTIEDVIYLVNGAKFFSKLDIMKAFHQVILAKESRNLTTITTHIGLYRYKRLHMGVSSASEIFSEVIREIIEDCPGTLNIADDILVFGANEEEHRRNLIKVLERLEERGITLNWEKCQFGKVEVVFFGLKISEHGISPTLDRCEALKKAKPPSNAKELHSLLGLAQYSSRFIADFATITASLWKLTKKDITWSWSKVEDEALEKLKSSISDKAMSYFDKDFLTILMVDASPVGLGAVLAQLNPLNKLDKRLVAFASRLLTDVETRYSQCEKEALAAVWGCEKFWLYLYGQRFQLVTDNRAVQLIFKNPNSKPPARIQRWALRLMEFNYEIIHAPGNSNVADYFSRQPVTRVNAESIQEKNHTEAFVNMIVESSLPEAISMDEIVQESKIDAEIKLLRSILRNINVESIPKSISEFKNVYSELSGTDDGLLLRNNLIVIPKALRDRVVKLAHNGHQGIVKTKALIRSRVWFPGIDAMVERAVSKCIQCQVGLTKSSYEPLRPSVMPAGPWQEVSGDFYGPFADGSLWFVNLDDYSRFFDVRRVSSSSGYFVIPALESLFSLLGVPLVYKTDNGPPFNSNAFSNLARRLGFTHRHITPYWPRANGEIERCMRNLTKVVQNAKISGINKETELQNFLRVYRDTPHSSTKTAPSLLMFGRSTTSGLPAIDAYKYASDPINQQARKNDAEAKQVMKDHFDSKMKANYPQIQKGSRVFVKQERKNKSMTYWDPESYVVTEIKGSMITAARDDKLVTRNSSFFKLVLYDSDDQEVENEQNDKERGVEETVEENLQQESGKQVSGGDLEHVMETKAAKTSAGLKKVGRPRRDETDIKKRSKEGRRNEEMVEREQDSNIRRSERLKNLSILKTGGKM